jgi:prevent-host-death family protein
MTKSSRGVGNGESSVKVGVHEAKTRLSELLRYVESGHVVEILRGGSPVARLVPAETSGARIFGQDAGSVVVSEDFDAPLPDQLLADFEN